LASARLCAPATLLGHWLALSATPGNLDLSPDTARVLETLQTGGALFFSEIRKRAGVLPSRVEQALGELAAQGLVTSDSFEGLRALLVPREKRVPFADTQRKRHHRSVTSVEFAGRWSLLRALASAGSEAIEPSMSVHAREEGVEAFAWALLRRYGVVFRRLLERESLRVSWFELGRFYRRLEARGEIRGGFFYG
jgi:ATP-dependent helicase Lhr and Lhr-like helicase